MLGMQQGFDTTGQETTSMLPLAQVETAVNATSTLLSGRSDAMVILVLFCLLLGLWMWFIYIPRQESDRKLREADKEIFRASAATLDELSKVTTSIHSTTFGSNTALIAILDIKHIEIECIEAVAEATKCDIGTKLAEMKGVLRAVKIQSVPPTQSV